MCPANCLRCMGLCPLVPGGHVGSPVRHMGLCPFVPSKLPQVHGFVPVCAPSPCRGGRGTKRNRLVGADVCAHLCLVGRGGYNTIRCVRATEAQTREPRVAPRVNGKSPGEPCSIVVRFCPTSVLARGCRPPLKLFRLQPHAGRGGFPRWRGGRDGVEKPRQAQPGPRADPPLACSGPGVAREFLRTRVARSRRTNWEAWLCRRTACKHD